MLTFLFVILMLSVFGKIIHLALKAAWGISKFVSAVILLPLFLVWLVIAGCIHLALIILIITGLATLTASHI